MEDGGVGGDSFPSSSSSDLDASATDGATAIDAPVNRPETMDDREAGAGGSGGKTGTAGKTGTRLDAGPDSRDGRAGGTGGTRRDAGDAGSTGGTIAPDAAPDSPDAAPDRPDSAVPDTNPPDAPCVLCTIGASLIHRYRFDGSGTKITDSVGTADGTAVNATLSGNGTLVLAGGTSNQHATLPAGIFSSLTSATLEIWVTWSGGGNNQRIIDFGSNRQSGSNTYAVTTVIVSPNTYLDNTARLRASFCSTNCGEDTADDRFVDNGTTALPTGSQKQIVVVFDGAAATMSLYLDGEPVGTPATDVAALSQIDDVNNYLGKSQYSFDQGFGGTYHEFRIYDAALTAEQVKAIHTAGTSAQFDR